MEPASNGKLDDAAAAVGPSQQLVDGPSHTLLLTMRSTLTSLGVSLKGVDDSTLSRFLRARAMNVQKASQMFADHQTWRALFVPLGFIPESEVQTELAQGKAYLQGISKRCFPLIVMLSAKHYFNKVDFEEFKKFVVYVLDKTIASAPSGVEKYMVIVDVAGMGYKNMDIRALVTGLQFLQNYYPERLEKLFFLNANTLFSYIWKFGSPILDKITREKIKVLEAKKMKDVLLEEFGEDVLPQAYGGKANLVPIQDAHI